MWRAFFLAIGISLIIIGAQCLVLERERHPSARLGTLELDGRWRGGDDLFVHHPEAGEWVNNFGRHNMRSISLLPPPVCRRTSSPSTM